MRKYFIDNIRWLCILLLFPYHTCMIYNNFGSNFYIKGDDISILSEFIYTCYPWFMPLLFVLAGASTSYALKKRTNSEYIKERFLKLFIPLVSGILLLVPIQTFYAEKFHNGYTGSYLNQYTLFFTKVTDLTGYTGGFTPAHLWFILYLFIISLIAIPIILGYKKGSHKINICKVNMVMILCMFIPVLLMSCILDIGGKSIGEYLMLFLLGYIFISEDIIQIKLESYRWQLFIGVVILTILNFVLRNTIDFSSGTLVDIYARLQGWVGILAIVGLGKHYLEFHNKVTLYLSKASFPIYILHQSCLVLVAYYVFKVCTSVVLQVILIIFLTFIVTILSYEIIKRIPFVRTIFGIKS